MAGLEAFNHCWYVANSVINSLLQNNYLRLFSYIQIVANSKSGDNTAENVIAIFRSVLNPIQIFELNSSCPKEALNLITKIRTTSCRILVAGGDGTIGWMLNEIARKNIKPIPEVCILPVGTGNDLSRVLGWGAVPPAMLNPSELCDKVNNIFVFIRFMSSTFTIRLCC